MAGQFDFISPGAAFSDQLTQQLVERRAQDRQNLINTLGVRADQRADQEAQQMQQWRNYQMASGKQKDEIERVNELTKNMPIGADPQSLGWSPDDIALGKKYGRFQQITAPPIMGSDSASGPIAGTPAQTTLSHVGSPQQQEKLKLQKATQAMLAGVTDADQKAALTKMVAANDGVMPQEGFSLLMPNRPVWEFNQMTNKFGAIPGASLPPNADVVTHGYPPASYFDNRDRPTGDYAFGQFVNGKFTPSDDNDPKGQYFQVFSSGKTGHTFIDPTPIRPRGAVVNDLKPVQPIKFNEGASNTFNTYRSAFENNPNSVNGMLMRNGALGIVRSSSAPDKIKNVAIAMINNPEAGKAMRAQTYANGGWDTAKDDPLLQSLLNEAWPETVAQKYYSVSQPTSGGFISHFMGKPPATP